MRTLAGLEIMLQRQLEDEMSKRIRALNATISEGEPTKARFDCSFRATNLVIRP